MVVILQACKSMIDGQHEVEKPRFYLCVSLLDCLGTLGREAEVSLPSVSSGQFCNTLFGPQCNNILEVIEPGMYIVLYSLCTMVVSGKLATMASTS